MKIKDLIEQLQKLDGEKTIGVYNRDRVIDGEIEIYESDSNEEFTKEFIDYSIFY